MNGTLDRKTGIQRGCVAFPLLPGYELSSDDNVAAAQLLGMAMAWNDVESQADAAQDAALVYLEEKARGTNVVRARRIKHRLLWRRGDSGHHRPMLARSYREDVEPLPEWAQ